MTTAPSSAARQTPRSLPRQTPRADPTFRLTAVHQPGGTSMVTRKSLGLLTAAALVLLAVSGLIGKHHHGPARAVAFTAWWGFVICALVLVVASVATIARRRNQARS